MPKLDYLGRTTLPKTIRKALHLEPEDELEIKLEGFRIIIEPVINKCRICGEQTENKINKIPICKECLDWLNGSRTKKMG